MYFRFSETTPGVLFCALAQNKCPTSSTIKNRPSSPFFILLNNYETHWVGPSPPSTNISGIISLPGRHFCSTMCRNYSPVLTHNLELVAFWRVHSPRILYSTTIILNLTQKLYIVKKGERCQLHKAPCFTLLHCSREYDRMES